MTKPYSIRDLAAPGVREELLLALSGLASIAVLVSWTVSTGELYYGALGVLPALAILPVLGSVDEKARGRSLD